MGGHAPWDKRLPVETDEAELAQTRAMIEVLAKASVELGVTVVVEMDDEHIGEIRQGVPNRGISEILLAEWERVSGERRASATES